MQLKRRLSPSLQLNYIWTLFILSAISSAETTFKLRLTIEIVIRVPVKEWHLFVTFVDKISVWYLKQPKNGLIVSKEMLVFNCQQQSLSAVIEYSIVPSRLWSEKDTLKSFKRELKEIASKQLLAEVSPVSRERNVFKKDACSFT